MDEQKTHPVAVLVSDAWRVVLFWFLSMLAFGVGMKALSPLFSDVDSKMEKLLLSAAFSSLVALGLIYRASREFSSLGFLTNMALRKGRSSWTTVAALPAVIGTAFAYVSSWIIWVRSVQPPTPLYEVLEQTQSASLLLVFGAMATLIVPLIEEIIFRGYFFYVVNKAKGERFAVYVVSIVFAFLHMGQYWGDWAAIGMVVVLGFTLTILRARTGSTLASVIAHYAYNAGVMILPVWMGGGGH